MPDFVRDSLPTRDRRTAQLEEVRVYKGRPERSGVHAEAAMGGTEGLRQERMLSGPYRQIGYQQH